MSKSYAWLIACLAPIVVSVFVTASFAAGVSAPWWLAAPAIYGPGYAALWLAYRPRRGHVLMVFAGVTLLYAATWRPMIVFQIYLACMIFGSCL